jgi:hypothetical protein
MFLLLFCSIVLPHVHHVQALIGNSSTAATNGSSAAPTPTAKNSSSNASSIFNACYLSSDSWSSASSSYASTASWTTFLTTSFAVDDMFQQYHSHYPNGHTTMLCDNVTRPMGSVSFNSGLRFSSYYTTETTSTVSYTVPPPSCTISPDGKHGTSGLWLSIPR